VHHHRHPWPRASSSVPSATRTIPPSQSLRSNVERAAGGTGLARHSKRPRVRALRQPAQAVRMPSRYEGLAHSRGPFVLRDDDAAIRLDRPRPGAPSSRLAVAELPLPAFLAVGEDLVVAS
jgi:hypothetical protein